MEGSFYNINSLFVATKEPSVTFDPSPAPQPAQQPQPSLGIHQDEESIDFSALVAALSPGTFVGPGSGSASGPLSSSSFFDTAESAFPFETNLMPGLGGTYGNDNGVFRQTTPPNVAEFSSQTSQPNVISAAMDLQDPIVTQESGKSKPGKASKKALDRCSFNYREKRERNNVAVRKSRIKSKQRVVETEKRVKELEDENGHLQNKIALLTKELNVLKSLFSSAGVPNPSPVKSEIEDSISCRKRD